MIQWDQGIVTKNVPWNKHFRGVLKFYGKSDPPRVEVQLSNLCQMRPSSRFLNLCPDFSAFLSQTNDQIQLTCEKQMYQISADWIGILLSDFDVRLGGRQRHVGIALRSIETNGLISIKFARSAFEKLDFHANECRAACGCVLCLWSSLNSTSKRIGWQISTIFNFLLFAERGRDRGWRTWCLSLQSWSVTSLVGISLHSITRMLPPGLFINGNNERSLNRKLRDD
jgi:hypothetical protein